MLFFHSERCCASISLGKLTSNTIPSCCIFQIFQWGLETHKYLCYNWVFEHNQTALHCFLTKVITFTIVGGRGAEPFKNWVTWRGGGQNFLLVREDKPEKEGWCRNKGVATFLLLYSSIAFTVCRGKVRLPLLLSRSSVFWVSHARFSSKSLLY